MSTAVKHVIVGALVGFVALDITAYVIDGSGSTVSSITLHWATAYQTIPYAAGVLMSHLFWPSNDMRQLNVRISILVACSLTMLAIDLMVIGDSVPIVYSVPGVVLGHALWPQPKPRPELR